MFEQIVCRSVNLKKEEFGMFLTYSTYNAYASGSKKVMIIPYSVSYREIGHFAQTLTLAQTCAYKLLEGTLIKILIEVRPLVYYPTLNKEKLLEGTLIKILIEVRPLVYYPSLIKEYPINLTPVFYLLRRIRLRSL